MNDKLNTGQLNRLIREAPDATLASIVNEFRANRTDPCIEPGSSTIRWIVHYLEETGDSARKDRFLYELAKIAPGGISSLERIARGISTFLLFLTGRVDQKQVGYNVVREYFIEQRKDYLKKQLGIIDQNK